MMCLSKTHSGWMARCPAHEDDRPILSVAAAEDGRVLLRSFAGCDLAAIVGAPGRFATFLRSLRHLRTRRRALVISDNYFCRLPAVQIVDHYGLEGVRQP
jgi:hypothetical protein